MTSSAQDALNAYQAAANSLQNSMTLLTYVFAGLLTFITLMATLLGFIIKRSSDNADEKMIKAEKLSNVALNLIKEAEEKHKKIIIEQKNLDKNVQELKKLVDSKEVDEKLKEIDDIKRFVIQTKNRIYCEDALDRAKRRFEILEAYPQCSDFIISDGDIYEKTLDLKSQINNAFTTLKASWMIFDQEQFEIQKNHCKRIMDDAVSLCDQLQEKFVTYLNDPMTQLRWQTRKS